MKNMIVSMEDKINSKITDGAVIRKLDELVYLSITKINSIRITVAEIHRDNLRFFEDFYKKERSYGVQSGRYYK